MIRTLLKKNANLIVLNIRRFESSKPASDRIRFASKGESKVPREPTKVDVPPPTPVRVDEETVALLEHLSLVDCGNRRGIETLEDAILFADRILHVDTEGVEPMYTVLEDRHLRLREDAVTEGDIRMDIMKNAKVTEEGYFVAPPGNIPKEPRKDLLYEEENNDKS